MINRVVLVGRLTKDPELRYTPSGVPMARFTIAVNRTFSNQSGEREADFIGCIAWRKQAENLANFMKKGSLIGVEGRIQTGSYEGQDGKRVYTTDVVADAVQFLEPRGGAGTSQGMPNQQYGGGQNYGGQPSYNNQPNQQFGGAQPQESFGSNQQPPQNQQNYTRVDEDPFANSKGPIEVSEDDLPF
ncbi:single-stranded DNA-binding protein [Lysinibacillus sp. 2017]|uniref:single-stranded DNA-binding protein n=1 Tax=unclassified Lysinibacillus TaxID=2636778 RepID=UPI000D527B9F|nr:MULTISPECIES: single-stranded DNA-binding protein [unclassified Lysinibacillus]AWE09170.1 single-stranded DNA-binding protein [Lysinibacillus sp. 2017]TGN35995.1 single-stranded DNA-binding protein [Lysinibacillus sp. S2017]